MWWYRRTERTKWCLEPAPSRLRPARVISSHLGQPKAFAILGMGPLYAVHFSLSLLAIWVYSRPIELRYHVLSMWEKTIVVVRVGFLIPSHRVMVTQ